MFADVSVLNGHKINRRVLASSVNFEVELETFAFVDPLQARTFHRADMHECIRLAVIPHEEAEALHGIEELDCPGGLFAGQFTLGGAAALTTAITATIRTITATIWAFTAAVGYRNDIADNLQVLRGNLAAAINQIEFQRLPFSKAGKAGTFDRTDVHERVFAALILLNEAEALLRIEEFYSAFASPDNLRWHAVETAACTAASTAAAATWRAATLPAATAAEPVTAAAAEPVTATTAETIAAATVIIAAESTLGFAAERGETIFTETIALVTAPAPAPFVVTHNKIRTFVTPPSHFDAGCADGKRAGHMR